MEQLLSDEVSESCQLFARLKQTQVARNEKLLGEKQASENISDHTIQALQKENDELVS